MIPINEDQNEVTKYIFQGLAHRKSVYKIMVRGDGRAYITNEWGNKNYHSCQNFAKVALAINGYWWCEIIPRFNRNFSYKEWHECFFLIKTNVALPHAEEIAKKIKILADRIPILKKYDVTLGLDGGFYKYVFRVDIYSKRDIDLILPFINRATQLILDLDKKQGGKPTL